MTLEDMSESDDRVSTRSPTPRTSSRGLSPFDGVDSVWPARSPSPAPVSVGISVVIADKNTRTPYLSIACDRPSSSSKSNASVTPKGGAATPIRVVQTVQAVHTRDREGAIVNFQGSQNSSQSPENHPRESRAVVSVDFVVVKGGGDGSADAAAFVDRTKGPWGDVMPVLRRCEIVAREWDIGTARFDGLRVLDLAKKCSLGTVPSDDQIFALANPSGSLDAYRTEAGRRFRGSGGRERAAVAVQTACVTPALFGAFGFAVMTPLLLFF